MNTKKIKAWLDNHSLFSVNGMCELIGLDSSNFNKYLKKEEIPEKYISKIILILKQYGYE